MQSSPNAIDRDKIRRRLENNRTMRLNAAVPLLLGNFEAAMVLDLKKGEEKEDLWTAKQVVVINQLDGREAKKEADKDGRDCQLLSVMRLRSLNERK